MKRRILALAAASAISSVLAMAPGAANALTIIPIFDSTITGAANAAAMEAGINFSVNQIDSLYSNDAQVSVLFRAQNNSNFLASSSSTVYLTTSGVYNSASAADAVANPQNTVLVSALANLATGNGANPNTALYATSANFTGLGFGNGLGGFDIHGNFTGSGGVDSVVTLSTFYDLNFTGDIPAYNGSNEQWSGIDTIEHEVNEVLGGGGAGSSLNIQYAHQVLGQNFGSLNTAIAPLDRFRYSAPGVASYSIDPTATAYFSVDGGATNLATFNQFHQGDFGDFGPTVTGCSAGGHGGPPDLVQDAFNCNNEPTVGMHRGTPEDAMLESIGWNPTPVPEPDAWMLMIAGFGGLGAALRRRRQVSATA